MRGVALGALSAGVATGVGMLAQGVPILGARGPGVAGWLGAASRAMVANTVTQGIAVAVGLQPSFSWASVAAAAAGAGLSAAVGEGMNTLLEYAPKQGFDLGKSLISGTASGFVGGMAASALRGGRMTVQRVAVDAFGNALGNSIAAYSWSGTARPSVSYSAGEQAQDFARENARFDSAYQSRVAQAISGPGYSEEDYAYGYAKTQADRYVDAYGGQATNTSDRLRVSFGSPNGLDSSQVPSAQMRFVEDYMARNPDASYPELQQAYDQAWAEQSDAHLLRQAQQSHGSAAENWTPTGVPDNSPLHVVGETRDGGLVWNTGAVSYPVTPPEIEVSASPSGAVPGAGLKPPPSMMARLGQGLLGTLESVTVEPVRQLSDLAKAGASVIYNEVFRKEGDPYWLPELSSNTAAAYANGTSQTKLILGSVPLLNVGVTAYDATTALMQGRYGDAAELGGGIVGGLAVGKGVSRFGGYGLTIEDIGATGLHASQAGAIGLKVVTPNKGVGTAEINAPKLDRNFWQVTPEGTEQVLQNNQFGKFYKSTSDGLWWSKDNAGHGGSEWKVFEETAKGLQWYRDANKYGDFIDGKHKGDIGKFIPWNKLNGSGF